MSNLTLQTGCYAYEPAIETQYDYIPSQAAGITFLSLFGLSLGLHIVQATWTRTWWGYLFAIGALTEVIGWAGRTWSSSCPYNNNAFLMQISTLIIAPTFFTAGIYVILGRLIRLQGPHTSPIRPTLYLWIFCTCDVVSLVVQAVGGGLASNAASDPSGTGNTKPGTDIMVAGILFQMVSIAVFTALGAVFLLRCFHHSDSTRTTGATTTAAVVVVFERRLKVLVGATSLSVVAVFVRSVYRCVELLQGWSGYLITHERFFVALDGALMVLAVGVFNVAHPGWLLRGLRREDRVEGDGVEMEKF